ncbi:MAG: diguanylate cyclase, partial [Rubrivivax sp.]|nr:diguanylate cyclase [Rubrivivax sp.]
QAAVMAERLRDAVAAIQTGLTQDGQPLRVTVSLGLSRPIDNLEQWREAWEEAELSLQAAKDAGRNCVVHPTVAPATA